jgi:hypothetical protein
MKRGTNKKVKKKILEDLTQAIDFVNNHRKGKVKAKSLKQVLNEL